MQSTATYYKLRDILTEASKDTKEIFDLARGIYGNYTSFTFYRRDENGEIQQHPCGTSVIRNKIRFCIELGLIIDEKKCSLTDLGNDALDNDRYDLVIQQSVLTYLERQGISWSSIESAVDKVLFPDAGTLYIYLSPEVGEGVFRTCLFLLSQCGESIGQNILTPYQKKMYLTQAKEQKLHSYLS